MYFLSPFKFAVVFFLLNSYFVAVAQLLIYVGAINVLIIFAVMFVNGSEWSKDKNYWTIGDGFTLLLCITIPFSLMTTIPDTSWYGILWTTRSNQIVEQGLINNVQQIGIHLATDFYLPFELISIILLVSGRKVSCLGPGGLTGRTASFRSRDIHPSHYGRICPIDTSEGINVGLTGSLAIHARIDHLWGSIESPFYEISAEKAKEKKRETGGLSITKYLFFSLAFGKDKKISG